MVQLKHSFHLLNQLIVNHGQQRHKEALDLIKDALDFIQTPIDTAISLAQEYRDTRQLHTNAWHMADEQLTWLKQRKSNTEILIPDKEKQQTQHTCCQNLCPRKYEVQDSDWKNLQIHCQHSVFNNDTQLSICWFNTK